MDDAKQGDLSRLDELQNRPDAEWVDGRGELIEDHDRGLPYDVGTLLSRRRALCLLGGLGAFAAVAACTTNSGTTATGASTSSGTSGSASTSGTPSATSSGSPTTTSPTTALPTTASFSGAIDEVDDETAGPYPGDGSSGPNVLDDSGIVRSDIRSSFGSSTTTADGVPFTIKLTVREAATGNAMTGAAVYVWHCDRDGNYSMYAQAVAAENYLRGVQQTDNTGRATFTSIYPACYSGRWPHVHFEVYSNLADATSQGPIVKTSQIALPKEACEVVYATGGYEESVQNLSSLSLATDNVFGNDGGIHQVATMSGDASSGYTAALTIGV